MFLHWSVPVICSSLFAQRYNRFAYTWMMENQIDLTLTDFFQEASGIVC